VVNQLAMFDAHAHICSCDSVNVVFNGQPLAVSVPKSETPANLLEAVFEKIKEREDEGLEQFVEPADLILRTSDGADLAEGAAIPADPIVATVPTTITVQFKYNDRTFSHEFELAATVADGLEFIVPEIKAEPEATVLFYAGKELKPTQRLSRLHLKPGSYLITCVKDSSPVLLQSAKGLQVRPRSFRFRVAEPKQEFTLEFRPTDLIDRVLTGVAERLKVDRSCVSIWFNDRILDEDVMLEVLGIELDDALEVRLQDESTAVLLSSLRASRRQAPPVDDEEILVAEQQAYAAISLGELTQLREIVKVNRVVRPELEIIELFLECGKDFGRFRMRLVQDECP
jgi:hypothetical protein